MEVSKVEIDYENGDSIEEYVDKEENGQKIVKIELKESAIFIYKDYIKVQPYFDVKIIPYSQIKGCNAVLDKEEPIKPIAEWI